MRPLPGVNTDTIIIPVLFTDNQKAMRMQEIIDFRWPVHTGGYTIGEMPPVPGSSISGKSEGTRLVLFPVGEVVEWRAVCETNPFLFQELADAPMTPDGVLDFATQFGFLFPPVIDISPSPYHPTVDYVEIEGYGEQLDNLWYPAIETVRALIAEGKASSPFKGRTPQSLASIDMVIAPPAHPHPRAHRRLRRR